MRSSSKLSEEVLWERACNGGVGPACQQLAYRVPGAETARRERYFQRACDVGWGDACLHLGMALEEGGSRAKAMPYWEKACRLGLTTVCTEAADMLSRGDGIPKDAARAATLEAEAWRIH